MNITEQLRSQSDDLAEIWSAYEVQFKEFRGHVKNDLSSLDAQARKTTDAAQKIAKAFNDVVDMLNSHEMHTAIENAERLARALESLNGVTAQKLVFATMTQKG